MAGRRTPEQTQQNIRENFARRAAARRGWRLAKIKRYDPHAPGYGRFLLYDGDGTLLLSNIVTLAERHRADGRKGELVTRQVHHETGATLAEVERKLGIRYEPQPKPR
jgi:hypothetical protein